MPQILFIVEMPEDDGRSTPPSNTSFEWRTFERAVADSKLPKDSKRKVSRNVWKLDAANSLNDLLELSGLAQKHNLPFRALLLQSEIIEMTK